MISIRDLALNGLPIPPNDARQIHVSSSYGNDSNSGARRNPVKSLAAGIALLRHGYPDWLLLRRGDIWNEPLGQWKKSGRSVVEPMVITSYGSAFSRPLLLTGTVGGIYTHGGGGSPATIDNLALIGIEFEANKYAGGGDCVGASFLQPASHVLIQDCLFSRYSLNLVFQGYGGRHTDFCLRKSTIIDAYTIHSIGGHSQGLYAYGVDGLMIEDNLFDHNGWNESLQGAEADIYSHNIYIDNDNTLVTVQGNVIARASSHGMQIRCGGVVFRNLFVRNPIALSVGGGNNPEIGGVMAEVRDNVILDGTDIAPNLPRGWGMWFGNISSGVVANNIISNGLFGHQPQALTFAGDHKGDNGYQGGIRNLLVNQNIVFNWPEITYQGTASQLLVTVVDNQIEEPMENYKQPGRSLADWNIALGGVGATESFLTAARLHTQEPNPYRAAPACRFIRGGFLPK